MNSYIILLRGINVGGRNILPMKDLREVLTSNGFSHVQTYIQSGNIIAQSSSTASENLSSLIQSNFGFMPEILVLDIDEFLDSVKNNPFSSDNGKTIHFYFCADLPALDMEKLSKLKADSEEYFLQGKTFYLHAPDGIGRSKLVSNIESCLNTKATGRNLNTIKKLQEMLVDT